MLSTVCSLLGLLFVAAAVALLVVPAAGLLVAGAELLWVGYALEHGGAR